MSDEEFVNTADVLECFILRSLDDEDEDQIDVTKEYFIIPTYYHEDTEEHSCGPYGLTVKVQKISLSTSKITFEVITNDLIEVCRIHNTIECTYCDCEDYIELICEKGITIIEEEIDISEWSLECL